MEYCSHDLFEAATYGIAHDLQQLINLTPPQKDLNRALVAAAAFGNDRCVDILLAVTDPKYNNSQAFRAAVRNNHLSCVNILLPVSDGNACNSEALWVAAAHGFDQYVTMLIPMASAHECAKALVGAVKHNRFQCVDLLCAHVDQKDILDTISTLNLSSEVVSSLYQIMAQHQHSVLSREVVGEQAHVSRKL